MGKTRTPNDDRANSKNANNPTYKAIIDNKLNQLNPNNPRYQGKKNK